MTTPYQRVTERDFLAHRAKLIDLAAYLDRLDRNRSEGEAEDFRNRALREAVALLIDGQPDRAKRVLNAFSDPTQGLVDHANGAAVGAYQANATANDVSAPGGGS